MKIAIDLRSLSSGSVSGVENYTLNLLDNMLKMDAKNSYTLFFNSFFKARLPEFHYINAKVKVTRWPNKLLNLLFKLKIIKLEQLIGDFDVLFMPNLNQFNIRQKAKLALTVHDLSPLVTPEFYDLKRRLWHRFLNYRTSFERADVIFAVSEFTKNDLIKVFSLPEQKVKVIYPGVESNVFNPNIPTEKLREIRNKYGLPGDYILFLNTIEPRKNLQNLLKAFEAVKEPCNLVIAGKKGWKYKDVFRDIKNSPKKSRIRYLGYISEKDKPAIIKLSKMLVYPSFYEGFGFQPLEAIFCGVAVIAGNVTSLPETIENAGLLVNPYNISEISKAITELLTNPALRQKLAENGKTITSKYSWESTARKTLNAIEQIWQK